MAISISTADPSPSPLPEDMATAHPPDSDDTVPAPADPAVSEPRVSANQSPVSPSRRMRTMPYILTDNNASNHFPLSPFEMRFMTHLMDSLLVRDLYVGGDDISDAFHYLRYDTTPTPVQPTSTHPPEPPSSEDSSVVSGTHSASALPFLVNRDVESDSSDFSSSGSDDDSTTPSLPGLLRREALDSSDDEA